MNEDKASDALLEVQLAATELAEAREVVVRLQADLEALIRRAVAEGVSSAAIATVAGVTPGRVSQIAPRPKPRDTPVQAGKKRDAPVRVTSPDTVPTLPAADVATLSGYASVRQVKPYGRQTAFYDTRTGVAVTEQGERIVGPSRAAGTVADVLAMVSVATRPVGRVFLVGPAPLDTSAGATQAEAVRAWAIEADLPDGWEVSRQGHYLHDPMLPTLRFAHESGGRVTVMRAAAWWGETDADAETCAAAWRGLGLALDRVRAFAGAGLADTPATTGRALWLRTIPEGKAYPVLSDEYRELIQSTSGQGRIELRPPAVDQVPGFSYLDGRFMYAALTYGMPVGEPTRWTGEQVDALDAAAFQKVIRGRGRWRITVTVPEGWEHVGLFMAPDGSGGWRYPSTPGETFTTWADGSEVWVGLTQVPSWEPVIHEGITWAEGKPLDTWRAHLVDVWRTASDAAAGGNVAAGLAARAVRSIVLYALGAFAARTHNTTGSCSAETPELVPDNVVPGSVTRVGDSLVWEVPGALNAWSAATAHPEWSATVWARARTRLLTGKGAEGQQIGALHLPADRVIAFATDALYLAGEPPAWSDDGEPGRFRVKGHLADTVPWPTDRLSLYGLRDRAED